jgi:gluconolactonase
VTAPLVATEQISVYADGLDHPEGVTVGPDGLVYGGGEAGQVYRIDPASRQPAELGRSGGLTLGLALDGYGCIYTCNPVHGGIQLFSPCGHNRLYATGDRTDPVVGANHLAFDSRGNLYFSDSGHWKQHDGRIYRVPPGGRAEVWCTELRTLPNGVCVGPGETHLYVAMSLGPGRISRVEILPNGSAGPVEDVAIMEGTLPDGLAFDENGDLYVVTYRPDAIYMIPSGSSTAELYTLDLEGAALASPTNIAFGFVDGEPRLFVANIGRWHIAELPVPAPGLPLHYPRVEGLGWEQGDER